MSLEALYQDVILDHAKHPHGAGLREPYAAESHQVNTTCGDEITLRLAVADGRVADVSYAATGCAISQAAASVLHELVVGETVDDALRVAAEYDALMHSRGLAEGDPEVLGDAVAFAGVSKFPARVKCALLPWMAWRDALDRTDAAPTVRAVDSSTHDAPNDPPSPAALTGTEHSR